MDEVAAGQWEESWKKESAHAPVSVSKASTLEELESVRLRFLGRKGSLTLLLKSLKDLPLEERRRLGGGANEFKEKLEQSIDARRRQLEREGSERRLSKGVDVTLPGSAAPAGRLHPLTQIEAEIASIFERLGFSWAEGPLAETEYYNFEALNIPADHPARDTQDTFYLREPASMLLRTHTSPVQVRRMESCRPPVRIIAPGRVFRHEAVDASHSAVFHQVEGLYVDKNVSMADLKGTLDLFLRGLFGPNTHSRFRPSYFPFTEPSAEVDIQCLLCSGSGCPACKRSGWMEVLGAGLVHPNVFKAVGYNPELWSGYAFGMGVERIAMLKLGVPDIRMFYENDIRFLEQF